MRSMISFAQMSAYAPRSREAPKAFTRAASARTPRKTPSRAGAIRRPTAASGRAFVSSADGAGARASRYQYAAR